jgi:hypothetical protein
MALMALPSLFQFVNADMRQQALLGAVFADDVNAAFWATPNTKGELGAKSMQNAPMVLVYS